MPLFWIYWASVFTLFGLALSNGLLALVLLSAPFVRRARTGWWSSDRSARRIAVCMLVFAVTTGVSALFSLRPGVSLENYASSLFTLSALPLAVLVVSGARDMQRLLDAVVALGVLSAAVGIAQSLMSGDTGDINGRAVSLFSHYMTYSGVLVIALCVVLARAFGGQERRRFAYSAVAALLAIALLLTLTRGAWIAAAVAVAVAVTLRAPRRLPHLAVGLVLGAIVLALVAPNYWSRVHSIVDWRDESNFDRLCMLWSGAHMVKDRPLVGLGDGMVAEYYAVYRHPEAPRRAVMHLHNTYTQMAAELGLPSLVAYLALLLFSLLLAVRLYRRCGRARGRDASILLACVLTVVTFSVAGLFEANWRDSEVQRLMLVILAVPIVMSRDQLAGRDQSNGM